MGNFKIIGQAEDIKHAQCQRGEIIEAIALT